MFDPVQWILRMSYYHSVVLGVFNFEVDMASGLARITRRASIYAILANVVIIFLLIGLTRSQLVKALWAQAGLLHEYLFLAIHGMRLVCVMASLVSRWWQRQRVVSLVNGFRLLAIRKPEVMRMWRRGVIYKSMSVCLSEMFQVIVSLMSLWPYLTLSLGLGILVLYLMTVIVNVVIAHFYFTILNIHSHYILLNRDLRAILDETRSLEYEERKATLMTKCCSLADRLEDIAHFQYEVQTILESTAKIFGIQGLCVAINSYISMIAIIYLTFSAIRQNEGSWNPVLVVLCIIQIFFYFADNLITINNAFFVLYDHEEMGRLMESFSTLAQGLDERLETVIESFQLQLASKPIKLSVLGLYNFEPSNIIYITSSVVTNALVLIQYDLKNSIVPKPPSAFTS